MNPILAILRRDLRLAARQGGGLGAALGFILTVIVLMPLSLGPDQALLQRLAPGILWLALLLSVLLTADRIFSPDLEDGSLDIMVMATTPLELTAFAKAIAHWLSVSLPLAVLSPLLGVLVNLDAAILPVMLAAMIAGSLGLSMLAALGGAITAGLRRGSLLATLLILPLYIPLLIFGVAAAQGQASPAGSLPSLLVLCGITLITIVICPWASAAALRAYLK